MHLYIYIYIYIPTRPSFHAHSTMRKTVPKYELPEAPLPANVVKTLIDDEVGVWFRFDCIRLG